MLTNPAPRAANDDGKVAPCGGVAPTGNPLVYAPGETITVEWMETIDHPGHYRIAFSPAGDAEFENYILMDNIPDEIGPKPYTQSVTLPDMECEGCTIQLIQCMQDGVGTPNCDNYYSCADIALRATAADGGLDDGGPLADGGFDGGAGADAAGPPAGVGDAPGLCSVAAGARRGSSPATGLGLLAFLLAALVYRTRTHRHS